MNKRLRAGADPGAVAGDALMQRRGEWYLAEAFHDHNGGEVPMKRSKFWSAALVLLTAAACGPGEVVVTAELDRMDPQTGEVALQPVQNMRVDLVPYDRDQIFDSLSAAAASPEPQMPQELVIARDSIIVAQQEWRAAESEWLALRERLQEISEEMDQFSPAESRYAELFAEFDQLEVQYLDAEDRRNEAFQEFDRLQQETFAELEQHQALVGAWEDDAFADFSIAAAERSGGRDVVVDTTDATGRTVLRPDPGEWWVYARQQLATEEFYWNVPIQVDRGDPVEVRLTRENAEVRPVF